MTRALLLLACLALASCANRSTDPGPAYWQRDSDELRKAHHRGGS